MIFPSSAQNVSYDFQNNYHDLKRLKYVVQMISMIGTSIKCYSLEKSQRPAPAKHGGY